VFREFILLKHRDKAEKFLDQDTDPRCDVFGVGATFYHLLTNQVPADVTKRALGIWEMGTDELIDPSEINPEIPPAVSAWLMKAMAFEREDRFTSASEMKEALQKITVEGQRLPFDDRAKRSPARRDNYSRPSLDRRKNRKTDRTEENGGRNFFSR
jgi:serine/threonine protein kinase